MTSGSRHYSTLHIPDDGTRYTPGEIVHADHPSGRVQLVRDPESEYEVMNCRRATEYGDDPPLLRVDLRTRRARPRRLRIPIRGLRGLPTAAELPHPLAAIRAAPAARPPRRSPDRPGRRPSGQLSYLQIGALHGGPLRSQHAHGRTFPQARTDAIVSKPVGSRLPTHLGTTVRQPRAIRRLTYR